MLCEFLMSGIIQLITKKQCLQTMQITSSFSCLWFCRNALWVQTASINFPFRSTENGSVGNSLLTRSTVWMESIWEIKKGHEDFSYEKADRCLQQRKGQGGLHTHLRFWKSRTQEKVGARLVSHSWAFIRKQNWTKAWHEGSYLVWSCCRTSVSTHNHMFYPGSRQLLRCPICHVF